MGSGHTNERVGATGYGKSREEIETIVYKWKWPEENSSKSLWNLDGMKYFHRAEKNGSRFMIVKRI